MNQGTPCSSQLIFAEAQLEKANAEIESLRQQLMAVMAPRLNEIAQVVVFAGGGCVLSVAVRPLPKGDVPCIVVDYDDRHDDAGSLSPEDFERKKLGITREEFGKQATYIW